MGFVGWPALQPLLAADITVGTHIETHLGPLTMDLDTLWATGAAVVVVVAMGLYIRRKATSGVPGKFQLTWELSVSAVTRQVQGSIGPRGQSIIPLALALGIFIFVANFFEIFTIGSRYAVLAAPTENVNLPAALAIFVFILVHIASIRARGLRGYVRHYFMQPLSKKAAPINLFMNSLEELIRPVTLTLRLFGNLFSGALMLALIAAVGAWNLGAFPIGDVASFLFSVVWKLFDVFVIGPIQAFIFALLTITYFDSAMATDH